MPKSIVVLIFTLLMSSLLSAQTEISWRTLADVNYTDKYFEEEKGYYLFPTFGESVKALEGEEVILEGYILALDPEENYYLLSMNPYASCFFCGNAGPETVVELEFKKAEQRFKMDQRVTLKGTLKLNKDNIYQCNYILEKAVVYKE